MVFLRKPDVINYSITYFTVKHRKINMHAEIRVKILLPFVSHQEKEFFGD